jgi:hypothetical protein
VAIALGVSACVDAIDGVYLPPATSATASNVGGNQPPTISGAPQLITAPGNSYSFTPQTSDPDGDRLGFSIRGKPEWAIFDPNSGELSGTPAETDVGIAAGIVISVSDGTMGRALPAFSIFISQQLPVGADSPGEFPPEIFGNPASVASVGNLFIFQPTVTNPDGRRLEFAIVDKPGWLDFDPASGTLSGIPEAGDIGAYDGISIIVSDGFDVATLGPFGIEVVAIGSDSVTISWRSPTENEDGSPLLDLAGFRILYGPEPGNYPNLVDINNPGVTTLNIDNLTPNTYYFVLTAYNADGVNSGYSNEATLTLD